MKKIILAVTAVMVVALASQAAWAQAEGATKTRGEGRKAEVIKELNLTPDQQAKFEENRKAQREEMLKLREAIKAKHEELKAALKNPAVTRESVEPLAAQIKALHAQMVDQRIGAIFAAKAILTPEQFAKFQQMADKRKDDKGGRSHRDGKEKPKDDN